MNMFFEFFWEVWHYVQTSRRDEPWVRQIIEMAEEIQPSWKPDREKLEALDLSYNREVKSEQDFKVIKAFVEAAKKDLAKFKEEKVKNLLAEICSPTHQEPILQ